MDGLGWIRGLHVLGVVLWFGGIGFVAIALPGLARGRPVPEALQLFAALERRFVWAARGAVLLVGASGAWLAEQLALWPAFLDARTWWLAGMAALWAFFAVFLLVVEPLAFHRVIDGLARRRPVLALRALVAFHWTAFLIGALVILGSIAGVHG
ncbi:MAG: hypothetical protein JNK11_15405 [Alphaproteobacteria bacterium]|nr:hypothetical protein [Alphaproteobacteria bacterium]